MVTYPEDWKEVKLLGCVELVQGLTYKPENVSSFGTLVLRSSNIQDGHLDLSDNVFVDMDIPQKMMIQEDDILVCVRNGSAALIGKSCVLEALPKTTFGAFMSVLRGDSTGYIAKIFESDTVQKQVRDRTNATINQITKKDFESILIPLPAEKEQKAIANALSQFDELIANLNELIEKKRNIREGAIQDIFSKTDNIFTTCKMASLGTIYSGISGKSKSDFGSGPSFFIPFLNVLNNVVIDSDYLERVNIAGDEKQNNVKANDLFFNTSSETPEEVGLCAVLLENINRCYLNSFCFGFRLNENAPAIPLWLSYFFNSPAGRKLMSIYAQGSTRYNLSKRRFLDIEIQLPSVMAQQEIVDALVAMDFEIAALEEERDKMIQIRDGAMDDLLTGRVRLDFEGDCHA